jgi:hypothetical protein
VLPRQRGQNPWALSQSIAIQSRAVDASAVKRLLADFDKLWETIPTREQVRTASLMIEKVDFDGVGGRFPILMTPARKVFAPRVSSTPPLLKAKVLS